MDKDKMIADDSEMPSSSGPTPRKATEHKKPVVIIVIGMAGKAFLQFSAPISEQDHGILHSICSRDVMLWPEQAPKPSLLGLYVNSGSGCRHMVIQEQHLHFL
jgi:hypothetical protein